MWKIFFEYSDKSKCTLTGKHKDIPLNLAIKYHNQYGIHTVKSILHLLHGLYATKAKAKKAMEMLRTAYQYAEECKYIGVGASQPGFCFQFPADEELAD